MPPGLASSSFAAHPQQYSERPSYVSQVPLGYPPNPNLINFTPSHFGSHPFHSVPVPPPSQPFTPSASQYIPMPRRHQFPSSAVFSNPHDIRSTHAQRPLPTDFPPRWHQIYSMDQPQASTAGIPQQQQQYQGFSNPSPLRQTFPPSTDVWSNYFDQYPPMQHGHFH
ncbi:hypothetical protein JCM3765_000095 [Sporobolomyces pararoseus]